MTLVTIIDESTWAPVGACYCPRAWVVRITQVNHDRVPWYEQAADPGLATAGSTTPPGGGAVGLGSGPLWRRVTRQDLLPVSLAAARAADEADGLTMLGTAGGGAPTGPEESAGAATPSSETAGPGEGRHVLIHTHRNTLNTLNMNYNTQ